MTETLDAVKARYPGAETFRFGDQEWLVAELLGLVRSGKKRATCMHMQQIADGEAPPKVGRRDIALTFDGRPALVIETQEVRETTYREMTEEMALMEGENDSLDGWKEHHKRYYERLGVFDPDMKLLWERFEVVEDLGSV